MQDSLSPAVWNDIYRAIRSEIGGRTTLQGMVSQRDKAKGVVWVSELSSEPIEVVGQGHDITYFAGSTRKVMRVPPAVPDVGDVVLLLRTSNDLLKCVGVLSSTTKWSADPALGLLPPDSITAREIAADAVGASEIAADAVGTSELGPLAVTNDEVAVAAAIEGSKFNWHLGTTPPGSPTDNMLWIYDGGTFYWMFVYDSGETTYKWKFVGGPPLSAYSETDQGTAGSADFTNAQIDPPRNGEYAVSFTIDASGTPNVGTKFVWVAYVRNSAGAIGSAATYGDSAAGATSYTISLAITDEILTLTNGDVIYLHGSATLWDYLSRWRTISIVPVRVI
jgi:hypothetical protein